jgi:hypothetical protein
MCLQGVRIVPVNYAIRSSGPVTALTTRRVWYGVGASSICQADLSGKGYKAVVLRRFSINYPSFLLHLHLSDVWGDPKVTQTISVSDHRIPVAVNLVTALRYVKVHWTKVFQMRPHEPQTFRLWADAICINQADVEERNHQIRLMRAIYAGAELVVSWLCGQDDEITLALDSIHMMAEIIRDDPFLSSLVSDPGALQPEEHDRALGWMKQYPSLYEADCGDFVAHFDANKVWKAIGAFLELPYWKRVWIFQEVALASVCLLVSGSFSIKWDDLEYLYAFALSVTRTTQRCRIKRPHWISGSSWTALTSRIFPWGPVPSVVVARFRMDNDYDDEVRQWILAFDIAMLQATDPKDHIYGLLGLIYIPITPDYSGQKEIGAVYAEFIVTWLDAWRRLKGCSNLVDRDELSFLRHAGTSICDNIFYKLPSWVPNFPARSGPYPLPTIGPTICTTHLFIPNTESSTILNTSLFVTGASLGLVINLTEKLDNLIHRTSFLYYIADFCDRHSQYVTGIPGFQAILQIMVSNDPEPSPEEACDAATFSWNRIKSRLRTTVSWEERTEYLRLEWDLEKIFQDTFRKEVPAEFEAPRVFEVTDDPERRSSEDALHLTRFRDHHILELSTGYIGLAPRGTFVGDTVCVLKGCPQPVVLRQVDGHHVHVGTCYILGLTSEVGKKFLEDCCSSSLKRFELG